MAGQYAAEETRAAVQPVTAWKSVPGFVRFAVWLWAIALVVSVILGVIALVFTLVLGGTLLGNLPGMYGS